MNECTCCPKHGAGVAPITRHDLFKAAALNALLQQNGALEYSMRNSFEDLVANAGHIADMMEEQ